MTAIELTLVPYDQTFTCIHDNKIFSNWEGKHDHNEILTVVMRNLKVVKPDYSVKESESSAEAKNHIVKTTYTAMYYGESYYIESWRKPMRKMPRISRDCFPRMAKHYAASRNPIGMSYRTEPVQRHSPISAHYTSSLSFEGTSTSIISIPRLVAEVYRDNTLGKVYIPHRYWETDNGSMFATTCS